MAVKETIAIIGAAAKNGIAIAKKLAQMNYPLLLISNDSNEVNQLSKYVQHILPDAAIDVMDCAKEGCWQADIIILTISYHTIKEVIKRIQEVATQKIVVSIAVSEDEAIFPFKEAQELQQLLPYSKVIGAYKKPDVPEIYIAGDDEESVETISNIIKLAGYQPKAAESLSAIKIL